jgi:hypothetical protein
MLVFIDESGDPGFKLARGSTPVFVAALVAFKESGEAKSCCAAIDALAVRLRFGGEFKFSGSRPEIRDAFFKAILSFDFCVRAIVVGRSSFTALTFAQTHETKVTRSCYALNASDCANVGRAESGGNKTCRGYITSNCVQDR